MSVDTMRERLSAELAGPWNTTYPAAPIQWENHKLQEQPDDEAWLDVDLQDSLDTERGQLGVRYFVRKYGVVVVAINVPESTGTKQMNEMTSFLDKLLSERVWTLIDGDRVRFDNMVVKHHGSVDGYYYHRLIFGYTREECFDRS